MSFRRYAAYKESGEPSLGLIPSDWRVVRVGDVAAVLNGYPFDAKLFDPSGAHPLVRIRDLGEETTATRYTGEFIEAAAVTSSDVLIGMDGDFNVGRWYGVGPALLNQRMCCLRCLSPTLVRLLEFALPRPLQVINDLTYATTVKHLSSSQVEKIRIARPPTEHELACIVGFLDRETAKIDALIAEQEQLITLLTEKRQAVISHAVTQGLDPSVPMKDSGVEWLGKVPAHWAVCTLRRVIRQVEQGWSPECEAQPADGDRWGVLKAGCVNRGVFVPEENKSLPDALAPITEYEVKTGDVLMSRASGSPELVGSTALVGHTRPRLMLSDKIFRIHLEKGNHPGYFVWAMNAKHMREQIEQALSGGNGLANNLPQGALMSFVCVTPPAGEQAAISASLNEETSRLDKLVREAARATELLQERRSALISAAVTGQIDVRGWAEKEAA